MERRNVQSSRGVTLVGGGDPKAEDIRLLLTHAPDLVAADGGANFAKKAGLQPLAVMGDFDSLREDVRASLPETRFIHVAEQNSTDFEKCLTLVRSPFILATGFTSARVDHTLAALSALSAFRDCPVILLGPSDVVFAAPTRLSLNLPLASRLSLFPMRQLRGTSKGLKWPIDGLTLEPGGQIGTSNQVDGPVELEFDQAGCLVILPRDALEIVIQSLTAEAGSPAE